MTPPNDQDKPSDTSRDSDQYVSDAWNIYKSVRDELQSTDLDLATIIGIAEMVRRWKAEKDPYYMDVALLRCAVRDVAPTETMNKEIATVCRQRLFRSPSGSPKKVRKDLFLDHTLHLIAEFVALNTPLERAARKAQAFYNNYRPFFDENYKASTLQRYYTERIRNTNLENTVYSRIQNLPPEEKACYEQFVESLPEADENEAGNRRE